ncbi:hypothetical protein GW750_04445 [bacterium]|nr:hypothetical protein [bacterium]
MNILEDYIQHPLMPLKKDNPDINRVENNELCDDSIEVYIDLEESQLKDFSYT